MAVVRQKSGGGCCLFKLFLILVILAALLIAGVIGALYWGKKEFSQYATAAPLNLVYPATTAEQEAEVAGKWAKVKSGSSTPGEEKVLLTDTEVNALINTHPDWAPLKNRAFFRIKADKATALLSVPLSMQALAGQPAPEGTLYVNAVAELVPVEPSLATGFLQMKLASLKFESKSVTPQMASTWMANVNTSLDEMNAELATQYPNTHVTIEGDNLAVYRGSGTGGSSPEPALELDPSMENDPTKLPEILRTPDAAP